MSVRFLVERLFGTSPVTADGYQVISVTSTFASKDRVRVPVELKILYAKNAVYRQEIEKLLDLGYVIEIHRMACIPQEIRQAIERVSRLSQEGTLGLWMSRLLREGDRPTVTEREVEVAKHQGISLYEEVERIFAQRYAYKRIVLKDPQRIGVDASQQAFFLRLQDALAPHVLEVGRKRLLADVSLPGTTSWTRFFLFFICAGLLVQMLGSWMGVLAYVSAFVISGLYEEGRELWELQRAGYAGRQFFRRVWVLLLFFAVASGVALLIQRWVENGELGMGGFVFGLVASVLPIMFFSRALHGVHQRFTALKHAGKLRSTERVGLGLAWKEYVLHPAKGVALLTIGALPVLSALLFSRFPEQIHNGWLLIFLLLLEPFVTKLTATLFFLWPYLAVRGGGRFFA